MPRTITAEREGIALDALLWRVHGVRGRGLLEDTYALNPGLAGLGMHLPIGATVIIPDLPEQASENHLDGQDMSAAMKPYLISAEVTDKEGTGIRKGATMADEDRTVKRDSIHVEHGCQHPGWKKCGSSGYYCGKGATVWFCLDHRPVDGRKCQ